jgi:hypothetical protein
LQPLANVMAALYATGLNEQFFYGWADAIAKSSDDAVLAAARSLFKPNASVTGYLLPEISPVVAPISSVAPVTTEANDAQR